MNKTITLTPDEVAIVEEAVEANYSAWDEDLRNGAEMFKPKARERMVADANAAKSILKKLEAK